MVPIGYGANNLLSADFLNTHPSKYTMQLTLYCDSEEETIKGELIFPLAFTTGRKNLLSYYPVCPNISNKID